MNTPEIRFPEFDGKWQPTRLGKYFERLTQVSTVQDQYPVLTSSRNGLVRQDKYFEESRLSKRPNIGFNVLPPEYTTYRNRSDNRRFYFNTNTLGYTGVISRFYPVFKTNGLDSKFLEEVFEVHKHYLGTRAVGTSQTVLSYNELSKAKIPVPSLAEQKKIAAFLSAIDQKHNALQERLSEWANFKRGLIQALFSQSIRYKADDGSDYISWETMKLSKVLHEHKLKSQGTETVYSVSVKKGLVNQVEHLGRSYSAKDTGHYNRVEFGDVIYTKSPTGSFPLGIIKQSNIEENVIVSPLYGVFRPETFHLGKILHAYFEAPETTWNYLNPIVQKGAKNTISCTNANFLSNKLTLPRDSDEQRKIADALSGIDSKIDALTLRLDATQEFKRGLLQKMFV